jgi:hypothetical protein
MGIECRDYTHHPPKIQRTLGPWQLGAAPFSILKGCGFRCHVTQDPNAITVLMIETSKSRSTTATMFVRDESLFDHYNEDKPP